MSLDKVKKLMQEAGWGYLATTDGQSAAVRPMGGITWVGKELWGATFEGSDKVAQLRKKAGAEYCFADKEGRHVRITGPCRVSADKADKEKFWKLTPMLKDHYTGPDDPKYLVLRMAVSRVRFMDTKDMKYTEVKV